MTKGASQVWQGRVWCQGWGQRPQGWGLALTFTGHAVSSQPEARAAGAHEAAHGVVAGVVTNSSFQRLSALVDICAGALLGTSALSGLPPSPYPKASKFPYGTFVYQGAGVTQWLGAGLRPVLISLNTSVRCIMDTS